MSQAQAITSPHNGDGIDSRSTLVTSNIGSLYVNSQSPYTKNSRQEQGILVNYSMLNSVNSLPLKAPSSAIISIETLWHYNETVSIK